MSDDPSIIDVFEDTLGVPFDARWTKTISVDVPTARHLARAVSSHYGIGFRIPEKDPGELRPYLFHSNTTGLHLWNNFVRFEGFEYKFESSPDTDLLRFLKPFRLYAHGVCFLDPLPGLLDYFYHTGDATDLEKARLSGISPG